MLGLGISFAFYHIRLETINFERDTVEIVHDYQPSSTSELYFPQVAVCNNNFIQASFLEEYDLTNHSDLLIRYFYSGSPEPITEKEAKFIEKIEDVALARRVAGALMRFGNSSSTKSLLNLVENKTEEQLEQLVEDFKMPTPLALVMGLKPGMLFCSYVIH